MQKSLIGGLNTSLSFMAASMAALLAFAASAQAAAVAEINWDHSFLLQGSGRESPLVRFGFDPQPDPPGGAVSRLDLMDPLTPRLVRASPGGDAADSFFDVFFAIALPAVQLVVHPPNPCDTRTGTPESPCIVSEGPFEAIAFDVTDADGNPMFTVVLGFGTSGDGMGAGGAIYLNPQPEVPSLFGFSPEGDGGISFSFTGFSDIWVSLQVLDKEDAQISFSTVPEPATLGLLGFGLAGIASVLRRRAMAR